MIINSYPREIPQKDRKVLGAWIDKKDGQCLTFKRTIVTRCQTPIHHFTDTKGMNRQFSNDFWHDLIRKGVMTKAPKEMQPQAQEEQQTNEAA